MYTCHLALLHESWMGSVFVPGGSLGAAGEQVIALVLTSGLPQPRASASRCQPPTVVSWRDGPTVGWVSISIGGILARPQVKLRVAPHEAGRPDLPGWM